MKKFVYRCECHTDREYVGRHDMQASPCCGRFPLRDANGIVVKRPFSSGTVLREKNEKLPP